MLSSKYHEADSKNIKINLEFFLDLNTLNMLNQSKDSGREEFYVSSNPNEFIENAKIFYDVKTLPTVI